MVAEVGGAVKLRMLSVAGWVLVVLVSSLGGYLATQQFVGSRGVSPAPGRVVYFACCAIIPPDPDTILQSSYRPKFFTFDATGSHYIKNATWLEWNSADAIAHGTFFINTCSPACAGGRFDKSPVTARFTDPVFCQGHWFWSRVLLHFSDKVPSGEKQDDNISVIPSTSNLCKAA
jgi:hypothetical protein